MGGPCIVHSRLRLGRYLAECADALRNLLSWLNHEGRAVALVGLLAVPDGPPIQVDTSQVRRIPVIGPDTSGQVS